MRHALPLLFALIPQKWYPGLGTLEYVCIGNKLCPGSGRVSIFAFHHDLRIACLCRQSLFYGVAAGVFMGAKSCVQAACAVYEVISQGYETGVFFFRVKRTVAAVVCFDAVLHRFICAALSFS